MENNNNKWKIISCILAVALITVSCLYFTNLKNDNDKEVIDEPIITIDEKDANKDENILSLWTDNSKL